MENYDGFENSSLFFQIIIKQSKKVRHSTCLETIFILIPNFPQVSIKYAPKNQKRTIFHEFKQFWWIWSFMPRTIITLLCFPITIACLKLFIILYIFKARKNTIFYRRPIFNESACQMALNQNFYNTCPCFSFSFYNKNYMNFIVKLLYLHYDNCNFPIGFFSLIFEFGIRKIHRNFLQKFPP